MKTAIKKHPRPAPHTMADFKPHEGMGAIVHAKGTAFRVWAPHATAVAVIGSFNGMDGTKNRMKQEVPGIWYVDVPEAKAGDEYRFLLTTAQGELSRIDPYAREVTSSVGNGVIYDPAFDWGTDSFTPPKWNEMIIYELHVGTFNDENPNEDAPAKFDSVTRQFEHLKSIGVNTIQVMPIAEFAGDRSWGYNPAHMFAVEQAYGGPRAFKQFVKQAHANGFAVILDVVYNHFGPSDLDLWRFDGWSENDGGGIYFYNDWRNETPWGATRPDYGRGEVRQFIRDNAMMWLEEYRVDGLRMDMTLYIRSVRADGEPNLPEGWSLLQWINGEIRAKYPGRIIIAEDLQESEWLTKEPSAGGAGFCSQWDARFVHPIREAVIVQEDEQRQMQEVKAAIEFKYNDDAFQRVIYSESHDEVANGKARVPFEINPHDPNGWWARKRSGLAAALVFTSPGIPMLFQGQEFLEGEWFRDTVPLHWEQSETFHGLVRMYRDLALLRLNRAGLTKGLTAQHTHVYHTHDEMKMIAFRRWDLGGPKDEVVVVANFHRETREHYEIGFPAVGKWKLVFNSDATLYADDYGSIPSADVEAQTADYDGMPAKAVVNVGPYGVLIYARAE